MKQFYQKTAFNPNRSVVFNQPWKSGVTSMIDSYVDHRAPLQPRDLDALRRFIHNCADSSYRDTVRKAMKKTIKLEKQNDIYYPNLDPGKLSRPAKDDEPLKIQSNLEHRFVCLRGIFRYDVASAKAVQMVPFARNDAVFGVDYKSFDFEIFTDRKKKTLGCFYQLQYWHRGVPYAKIILVDERDAEKSVKGRTRGLLGGLKNNTIHKEHKYYLDREENSMVFENVIDCEILQVKRSKKTFETVFLYRDRTTLLLLEFSFDDLFNFSLRTKAAEELQGVHLLRIFSDSRRKILLGLFRNNVHNGIMLFYFRNPPEKNSFLQFKSINLQKSTSNLLKPPTKKELVSSNHIFKTEADNHILDFCATSTGFVILSLRNILFLNHKFKLLRSLNLKPFGLGHLLSVFPFGPSVVLNFLRRSFVCSPNSPPRSIVSLDPSTGESLAGLLPDRVLKFNHFTSLAKFEFELNRVFHGQFQASHGRFQEWFFDAFTASHHHFESSRSRFKQMVWVAQLETPSQELMAHVLMSVESFFKEKIMHRFFVKARALVQSSGSKSELDSSVFVKALSSQNFRKTLNNYFGFVRQRNRILKKVFSAHLGPDAVLFFLRNSHLPEDRFFLVDKFLNSEDLLEKLRRCAQFSSQHARPSPTESFLGLCVDLLKEIGPRGSSHAENKRMLRGFLELHFCDRDTLKTLSDRHTHDIFGLMRSLQGFPGVVGANPSSTVCCVRTSSCCARETCSAVGSCSCSSERSTGASTTSWTSWATSSRPRTARSSRRCSGRFGPSTTADSRWTTRWCRCNARNFRSRSRRPVTPGTSSIW